MVLFGPTSPTAHFARCCHRLGIPRPSLSGTGFGSSWGGGVSSIPMTVVLGTGPTIAQTALTPRGCSSALFPDRWPATTTRSSAAGRDLPDPMLTSAGLHRHSSAAPRSTSFRRKADGRGSSRPATRGALAPSARSSATGHRIPCPQPSPVSRRRTDLRGAWGAW